MRALEGITVLEFASYVSGPYAGMMLADLGAEVIKIESPDGGDPFRGWGAADYSATFGSVNRNKKSVVLDLKDGKGLQAARVLAESADVLIENFRVGTMDRLGLGYDALKAKNPRLIYASITGFGPSGPYADRAGYDTVGQAMSGLLSVLTDLNNPKPMGISLSDHLTGMMAAYGILGALMARERNGKGQRVDTSLLSATIAFLGENAARFFETKKRPTRETRAHSAQVYAFVDSNGEGFVVHLSSPTKFWEGLAKTAGHPEWKEDERFKTKRDRQKNYNVLHALLAEIFRAKDRDYWLARLKENDVPSAPIYTLDQVFADPQVKHLGLIREVPHKKLGHVSLVGGGITLSETPTEIRSVAPDHGQHTEEILKRIGMMQPAKEKSV
ncbi:MAG TPA: CoA transferase [Micropepsaceae bacterium]|nr:CoA transferase [Micropepsaceae bacterium]